MSHREAYAKIRDEILAFVAGHRHPALGLFRHNIESWGDQWRDVVPRHLPVSDDLRQPVTPVAGRGKSG